MPDNVPVVLIVDADPETHLVTDGAMSDGECTIMGARSAEMGLKLAERRPPSVLVVDAKLGGLGYLTERLKRLSPHIHLVRLVASDHAVDATSARAGATGSILRKPLDVVRFRSTLRTVLRLSAMSAGVKRMHGAGHDGIAPQAPAGGHGTEPPVPPVTMAEPPRSPAQPRVGNGRSK